MYKSKIRDYPFAIKTDNDEDFIVGRIIEFHEKDLLYKLTRADQIEGYRGDENDLYHREIVHVENMDDNNSLMRQYYIFKMHLSI